ncbi:MAG: tyrosine-type recombinase/integrase [Kiritimatiellae bacterium]|nr:tyrosine-type recombinase/integrase [Kiritimatiellia bacterium]
MRVRRNKGHFIERKSGSCQVRYPLGWDDAKKRYTYYAEDAADAVEAAAALKEINDFVYHGGKPVDIAAFRGKAKFVEGDVLTVAEFAERFHAAREKGRRFTPRTLESDRDCLNRAMPYIGAMPIERVTSGDIDDMLCAMQGDGADNLNGRAYSGTTALKTYATLNKLFKYAVKKGVVAVNPCVDADAPKADTEEKEALSLEQIRALHALIEQDVNARNVGIAIGLDAGLRLSEMLALTWRDYRKHEISVSKSLEKERQTAKKTKNEDTRVVPCGLFLVRVLDRWKKLQRTYFADKGLEWSEGSPIVSSLRGTHITQRNYTRWFEGVRGRYPVPDDWGFHGFRHTYVTIMNRDAMIDERTVQSLSGHRDERAFRKYRHTSTEWQREAARRFDALTAPDTAGSSLCGSCSNWAPSPSNPAVGACWAREDEGLPIRLADAECDTGLYEKGTTLRQSLLGYSA